MSREQVLVSIRFALANAGICPPGLPAARPTQAIADPLARFIERATLHACSHERLASLAEVPARALAWLATRGEPGALSVAAPLVGLNWPADLRVDTGAASEATVAAVSLAFAGIAESGTLVMHSGPESPITHNFVPEFHVIVLHLEDLLPDQEAVWTKLRATGAMPRALNLIAGPSRTGDVEQTIQIGAHGPRAVHLLLVG